VLFSQSFAGRLADQRQEGALWDFQTVYSVTFLWRVRLLSFLLNDHIIRSTFLSFIFEIGILGFISLAVAQGLDKTRVSLRSVTELTWNSISSQGGHKVLIGDFPGDVKQHRDSPIRFFLTEDALDSIGCFPHRSAIHRVTLLGRLPHQCAPFSRFRFRSRSSAFMNCRTPIQN
jgi:hypothetical protein